MIVEAKPERKLAEMPERTAHTHHCQTEVEYVRKILGTLRSDARTRTILKGYRLQILLVKNNRPAQVESAFNVIVSESCE
jgi:hypothetical protein